MLTKILWHQKYKKLHKTFFFIMKVCTLTFDWWQKICLHMGTANTIAHLGINDLTQVL